MGTMDAGQEAGRKPKRESSLEAASPQSKRHGGEVTLTTIQRLLEAQTKEIKQANAEDIRRACETLEATTVKRIDGVRNDVRELKHHLSQQEGKLDDVQRAQEALKQRVEVLEKRGCSAASTGLGELDKRLSLVVGGWPPNTRRDDVEKYVADTMKHLELRELFDKPPFCPGVRRRFVIAEFAERSGEGTAEVRERMSKIIKAVNAAQYNAHGMKPDAKLWCSANRGPQERLRAAACIQGPESHPCQGCTPDSAVGDGILQWDAVDLGLHGCKRGETATQGVRPEDGMG